MATVLVLAGLFVYLRLRSDLNQTINVGLQSRADIVASLARQNDSALRSGSSRIGEESSAQVLTAKGRILDASPRAAKPGLDPEELRQALHEPTLFDKPSGTLGVEGPARLLARPVNTQGRRLVIVVGASVDDRDEALSGLTRAFAIGAPIAILLASGIGYLVTSLALSPVEAMRRRAERVTLSGGEERLPLPPAHDEIRRLGETLNAMLARLEATFARERRFVADASHELRTPIAVLRAELEVAMRSGSYDSSVREALLSAIEEADRLGRLADDLLVIARADEGHLPIKRKPVDLSRLLADSRDRFAAEAAGLGREIVIDAPQGTANVDRLRVEQAINNLLDNALRHGAGNVRLSAERRDGELEIIVSDAGSGFPPELRDRAFERFARADSSRSSGGAGLGLAIVRAIATAHGGEAEIVGEGPAVRVRIRLPLEAEQA
jgi:two-component system OmpR family sensor kinase